MKTDAFTREKKPAIRGVFSGKPDGYFGAFSSKASNSFLMFGRDHFPTKPVTRTPVRAAQNQLNPNNHLADRIYNTSNMVVKTRTTISLFFITLSISLYHKTNLSMKHSIDFDPVP